MRWIRSTCRATHCRTGGTAEVAPITETSAPRCTRDDAPFGMDPPAPAKQAATLDTDADAELFGTVWPLGEIVKLDTTVDRKRPPTMCDSARWAMSSTSKQSVDPQSVPSHVGAKAGVNQSLDDDYERAHGSPSAT